MIALLPIHPAGGNGIEGWAIIVGAIGALVFARRRWPHVRMVTSRIWGYTGRIRHKEGRWLAKIVLGAATLAAIYAFAAAIISLVLVALLAGKLMQRGIAGTLTATILTGAVVAASILVLGHFIWAGALLAWVLELHRNIHTAFTRPQQPAFPPSPDASQPPPPVGPPKESR